MKILEWLSAGAAKLSGRFRRRHHLRVSIVMPVYNGADYIAEALRSALAQTYRDIEIVVVDDGSTDGSGDVVAEFAGGDPRVRLIRKENGGVASALNAGIAASTGGYFCWLSHDDLFEPEKVAKQVDFYAALDDDAAILYSDYRLIDANGDELMVVRLDASLVREKPAYVVLRGHINGCTIFAPRRLFDDVGLFDERLLITQDYDLWLRALDKYRFVHMAEPLVATRQHAKQGSRRPDGRGEYNRFWMKAADRIGPAQGAALEGSVYGFYRAMAAFLEAAAAPEAKAHCEARALDATRVSVVVPFHGDVGLLRAAVHSVLGQTHSNIDLIVVHDSPETDPTQALPAPMSGGPTIRVLCQHARGAGNARNFGVRHAEGEYVAFLDADDLFLPDKIRRQLERILAEEASVSHTSYFAHGVEQSMPSRVIDSGTMTGHVFPKVIGYNPMAMPTAMVRRDVLTEVPFPDEPGCEDFLWWIEITRRFAVLGIDEPLTVIRISPDSVAYDPTKQVRALGRVAAVLEADPRYASHETEITILRDVAAVHQKRLAKVASEEST